MGRGAKVDSDGQPVKPVRARKGVTRSGQSTLEAPSSGDAASSAPVPAPTAGPEAPDTITGAPDTMGRGAVPEGITPSSEAVPSPPSAAMACGHAPREPLVVGAGTPTVSVGYDRDEMRSLLSPIARREAPTLVTYRGHDGRVGRMLVEATESSVQAAWGYYRRTVPDATGAGFADELMNSVSPAPRVWTAVGAIDIS